MALLQAPLRPSTIADPFYGYDPQGEKEVPFGDAKHWRDGH
jgi:hypothetical protein